MQQPTIGRVVLYHPTPNPKSGLEPYPAIITHVWSETCVNLAVQQDGSAPIADTLTPTSVMHESQAGEGMTSWSWPAIKPPAATTPIAANADTVANE